MNIEELRKLLENSNDKFNILSNSNILSQYNIKDDELLDLIKDFLTDEQKLKLLYDLDISLGIKPFYLMHITCSLDDDYKMQLLQNPNFFKEHHIESTYIWQIIVFLNEDDNKQKLLYNIDLIKNELLLENNHITEIISTLKNDNIKADMIKLYELYELEGLQILGTFNDKNIIAILFENKYNFESEFNMDSYSIFYLLSKLNTDSLINIINNNKDFLIKNNIEPYHITRRFSKEKQLDFISKLNEIDLRIGEKRRILATLEEETKKEIDTSKFPKDYITAIEQKVDNSYSNYITIDKIIVNLDGDLKRYSDLDELLYINPMDLSKENKSKFLDLCEICPKIIIYDDMEYGTSTVEEYKYAEIWIESIIQKIDENWSDIQKLAFIDNAIGKKISYSPDYETEVSVAEDARALWKIISSGYGVCNGIAQIEKYILDKIGIETEIVVSENHAFLKVKNIDIPTENGRTVKGDTIIDPTWNLAAHRYGAMPENFCKSYSEIRKHDIMKNGTDTECHKNDIELCSATLNLDEENLRNIFDAIGIIDENGDFPIKDLITQSAIIDLWGFPEEESLKKQLFILANYYPEFATCNNSTSTILQGIILNQKNLKFNRCIVNRVYDREDKNKTPILYIYADLPEAGKKFYFADRNTQQFIELPQKEFEARFECYQMDIENYNGYKPWEDIDRTDDLENLATSSGNLVASKGDER